MKILIITVAGSSTRFSESVGHNVLKCLYYINHYKESLLYRMMNLSVEFDRYVIVGGYKYSELCEAISSWFSEIIDKIDVIQNKHYIEYGSGYSLFCGMKHIQKYPYEEIVFAEGDLFVDKYSFTRICQFNKSVISCNNEPILANKAVAFYFDLQDKIRYIYDTQHNEFFIKEPFSAIYNSGQIWKMVGRNQICKVYNQMEENDWKGTNLAFIEKFFNSLSFSEYGLITFEKWINCNSINDFMKIEEYK